MKNKIKTKEVEVLEFWNDTHRLTMLFQPIEEPEPEPELPAIPTGIILEWIADIPIPPEPVVPEIPINILLTEIVLSLPKIPTLINAKNYGQS